MTITLNKMDDNAMPERETQDDGFSKTWSDYGDEPSYSLIDLKNSWERSADQKDPWIDIFDNGQLRKRVIRKGKGEKPNRGDMCIINIIGEQYGRIMEEHDDLIIHVGDLDVIQGLDLTIALMECKEVAEIDVAPRFAYGTLGSGSIDPDANITYIVELKSIKDKSDMEYLTFDERRKTGNKKRERGNWWFIRKEFQFATQCYRTALQYLEIDDNVPKENEEKMFTDTELQTLLNDCMKVYNNLAAALIETEAYNVALENVNLVLKHQPNNTKALFRKGKILKLQREYGKAYTTFLYVQKLEPKMKSVQAELMSLKAKICKQNEKEKCLYAKMLGMDKDADELSKNTKIEGKSKIAKGILWTLLGASAAVVGILVHRFAS